MATNTPTTPSSAESPLSHIMASTSNVTSHLNEFSKDLAMAFPRLLVRAGSFAISVPERIDNIFGLRNGGSLIAEATGNGSQNTISAALSGDAAQASQRVAAAAPGGGTAAATEGVPSFSSLTFQQVRNFGGIFTYITSKWALACFTLVSLQIVIAA